jgi:glycosyltransferase involved in cell wall biosynthesis
MRILYCNKFNFAFSGTEIHLFELMRMMRQHGHETALFSMADERGEPSPFEAYQAERVDFKDRTLRPWEKLRLAVHTVYSRTSRRQMRRMIRAFRPDVAHVRNIYHHLSPSILWELKRQRVPVVYHVNDFKLLCPSYNLVAQGEVCVHCRDGKFWKVLQKGCYAGPRGAAAVLAAEAYLHKWLGTYAKCVDHLLAPSEFVKDMFVASGWDRTRITVLPHFQPLPKEEPSPVPAGAPILYFGRLSAEKGLADLLQAMQQLPHIPLQIAGSGPLEEELKQRAEQLRLRNVEFLGHVPPEELGQLISASMFTVMPSRAPEVLGKSILESYACGRAVVASDLGSRREVVTPGKTGILFQVGNFEQMACAISMLYDRPELASQMGTQGRERVRRRHSAEAHYQTLLGLYSGLAQSGPEVVVDRPSTSMRVAFIGGRGVVSKYSGIESYYEEVGQRLAAKGHEVTVYCRNYFTPPLDAYNGMRVRRLPTIRSKHLETLVHTILSTAHVMLSPCDIVHYHALGPALFSFLPRLMGKKTVVTVQGLDWQRKKWGRIASAVLRLGEQAAVRMPNRTMVVSKTLQQYYWERYGAETLCIPNGSEIRETRPTSIIRDWDLKSGKYVLFLGRFSPEKNCHLLIEAFERIQTTAKLVMAGGSSYSDDYATELRRHASPKIRLLDWVSGDALEELLTNALVFVLPSDLEGLSLALLDAMGAGVCVLTSNIPENREVVDGVGYTFNAGDVADLERVLTVLLSDPRICQAAGRAGQERIRQSYLWTGIAGEIERAYLQLLGWERRDEAPRTVSDEEAASARGLAA